MTPDIDIAIQQGKLAERCRVRAILEAERPSITPEVFGRLLRALGTDTTEPDYRWFGIALSEPTDSEDAVPA